MHDLDKKLLATPKYKVGFLQAAGVTIYIVVFILAVMLLSPLANYISRSGASLIDYIYPAFFLMAFVTSALITGSMVLAYPFWLLSKGKAKDAIIIVTWSTVWMIVLIFALFVISLIKF